jgi:hypothetical protein
MMGDTETSRANQPNQRAFGERRFPRVLANLRGVGLPAVNHKGERTPAVNQKDERTRGG